MAKSDDDLFDTRFEDKDVEIDGNFIHLGSDINLTSADPTLKKIYVGAGWDVNAFNADALDLDVSLFLLNKQNLTRHDGDFVFYNQPTHPENCVKHNGDSRTGAGDGDDENITIDLPALSFEILKILIVITVYKGYEKEQNLGMVRNAYIRIGNAETRQELCRYVLDRALDDQTATGIIAGELTREGPKWHFKPQAEFVEGGMRELATRYGMIINQE